MDALRGLLNSAIGHSAQDWQQLSHQPPHYEHEAFIAIIIIMAITALALGQSFLSTEPCSEAYTVALSFRE
jgi:hypothetical protein